MAKAYASTERLAIGALIRAMREERGLTQSELSDLAGLVTGTIHNLESGSTVRPRTMKSILEALGKQSKLRRDDVASIAQAYRINVHAIDQRLVQQSDEPATVDEVHARELHLLLDRVISTASTEPAYIGTPMLAAIERFMACMVSDGTAPVLAKRYPPQRVGDREVEVVEPILPASAPTTAKPAHSKNHG